MKEKKWPEDGYPDEPINVEGVVYENTEGMQREPWMQYAFMQEAERIGRFDKYRQTAKGYLDIAKEAKAYADQTLSLLMKILTELPFPKIVLQVEQIIKKARPIIERTVIMLESNMQLDHNGNPRYNQHNFSSAKLVSQLAYGDLIRVFKDVDIEPGLADEKQMELPAITDRHKRIVQDSNIPPNIRKREIPRLAEDIQGRLNAFAAGNALITLHDIDGLMGTLQVETEYFRKELEDWKRVYEQIGAMKKAGMPPDEIKNVLLDYGLKERTQEFYDMYLRLNASLKICLARIEFINQKDNEILAREYDRGLIKKLLREIIGGALKKGNEVSFVRNFVGKLLGRIENPELTQKKQNTYEQTLRQALKDRMI